MVESLSGVAKYIHQHLIGKSSVKKDNTPFVCSWAALSPMNAARTWTAVSWVPDGRLFAVGGLGDDREPIASVEMLQCSWDTEVITRCNWQAVAPLNHPRAAHGLAFIYGRLVAAGGKRTSTIEYFKLPCEEYPQGQWIEIRPMVLPLNLHALLPFKGGLLAVGKGMLVVLRTMPNLLHDHKKASRSMTHTQGCRS